MQSSLHRIVVVGGGAAGLELATFLGRRFRGKHLALPTLVDGSPTHIWKPLLHEVATGTLNTGDDQLDYFYHSHKNGYEFQFGWMNGLCRKNKIIKIDAIKDWDGKQIAGPRELPYDTLVMCVGGVSHSFGTPGVYEHCITLDSPTQAETLRRQILSSALAVSMGSATMPKLRIGIIGGGATGVELAAEIHHTMTYLQEFGANLFPEQLELTVIEGADRLLPQSNPALSEFATSELKKRNIDVRTNCSIKAVTDKGYELTDGTFLEKDIRVWTAGIKAPDWVNTLGLPINKKNQILTNEYLQCVDDHNVYALGDCAAVPWVRPGEKPDGLFLPATAQIAHQEAEYLVKKLEAKLKGKTVPPFVYSPKGMLVSLGETKAVGSLKAGLGFAGGKDKDYYVEGRGAKAIYSSLYRMHQAVLYGWTRTALLFLGDKLRNLTKPNLKLH